MGNDDNDGSDKPDWSLVEGFRTGGDRLRGRLRDAFRTINAAKATLHCTTCHRTTPNPGNCFDVGWPTCCGYTMTLDMHDERCIGRGGPH